MALSWWMLGDRLGTTYTTYHPCKRYADIKKKSICRMLFRSMLSRNIPRKGWINRYTYRKSNAFSLMQSNAKIFSLVLSRNLLSSPWAISFFSQSCFWCFLLHFLIVTLSWWMFWDHLNTTYTTYHPCKRYADKSRTHFYTGSGLGACCLATSLLKDG